MALPYETIAESFDTFYTFALHDLELLTAQDVGGNYAALLLVMTACEAAGRGRYETENGGPLFFGEYVLPNEWKPVASQLYDALRNGLAHSYETKTIVHVGDRPVEVVVSWREHSHLSYNPQQSALYVNVRGLAFQLRSALDTYEKDLKADSRLREKFYKMRKKKAEVVAHTPEQQEAWLALLERATIKAS